MEQGERSVPSGVSCSLCARRHGPEEACIREPTAPRSGAAGPTGTLVTHDPSNASGARQDLDPLIGTEVGSYRLTRILGTGGMGRVYLGEHPAIGSRVAIKFLHDSLAGSPQLIDRFFAEARAVNLVGHENIVAIHDLNRLPPNRYYIVMEYLEGATLGQVAGRGPMTSGQALPVLLQLCDALQSAHERGIVHRDLKPDNVFLVRRGRRENFVKLVDFGIAKLRTDAGDVGMTSVGSIIGTPEYMAPEQCDGRQIDGRADQYSLGLIAYQLATGRLPFQGGSVPQLLLAHLQLAPPDPRSFRPEIGEEWSHAILKALEKRPEDRYQSMDAFGEALADAAELEGGTGNGQRPDVLRGFTPGPGANRQTPPGGPAPSITPGPPVPMTPGPPASVTPGPPAPVTPGPPASITPGPAVLGTPPAAASVPGPAPQPETPRKVALFPVELLDGGRPPQQLTCADLSRGGAFVQTEGALPALFARVQLRFDRGEEGLVLLPADVVRHVSAREAQAWGMPPGFAVAFMGLDAAARAAIDRILGKLPAVTPELRKPTPGPGDGPATLLLAHYGKRLAGSPYDLLDLPPAAPFDEVRRRGRQALEAIRKVRGGGISAGASAQLEALAERLQEAARILGDPRERLELDLARGNIAGLGHCIEAMLPSELAPLRRAHLEKRPDAEPRSRQALFRAVQADARGELKAAVTAYEEALRFDPLNLELHRRHAEQLRRSRSGPG